MRSRYFIGLGIHLTELGQVGDYVWRRNSANPVISVCLGMGATRHHLEQALAARLCPSFEPDRLSGLKYHLWRALLESKRNLHLNELDQLIQCRLEGLTVAPEVQLKRESHPFSVFAIAKHIKPNLCVVYPTSH